MRQYGEPDYGTAVKAISLLFKALGDETRLRILNLLQEGELCVCDLTHSLCLPQSTVSRHLAILKKAGLVADRRNRTWAFYRLAGDAPPLARGVLELLAGPARGQAQARADLAALNLSRCRPDRDCGQPPERGEAS